MTFRWRRSRPTTAHTTRDARRPARLVATGFLAAASIGTLLLMLPVSSRTGEWTGLLPALFTSTSAVCVTGLTVVDTELHWSTFGGVVILGLVQVGGLGVMTLATLLGMLISDRMGLRMGLTVVREGRGQGLGDLRRVILGVLKIAFGVELVIASVLALRFHLSYDMSVGRAAWYGVFHSVSAFNNAGFGLESASLIPFARDVLVIWPISAAIIIGGIGFPVLLEVGRHVRRRFGAQHTRRIISVHTRLTVITYLALLLIGVFAFVLLEWTNQRTVGSWSVVDKITGAGFQGITVRTAGFASIDTSQLRTQSWLVSDVLMLIGGGSAGTAGGVKVTTFALLAALIWTEIRGEEKVHVLRRSMSPEVQRQAVTVALMAVGLVFSSTLALSIMTEYSLDQLLFEVISAFATVGLTTGITPVLPGDAQFVLIALMYAGRLGVITLAASLALRSTPKHYDYPEDRVVVG